MAEFFVTVFTIRTWLVAIFLIEPSVFQLGGGFSMLYVLDILLIISPLMWSWGYARRERKYRIRGMWLAMITHMFITAWLLVTAPFATNWSTYMVIAGFATVCYRRLKRDMDYD